MAEKPLKILIAGGGTGGHLFPGIAVAKEILARNPVSRALFVGTAAGLEAKVLPGEGFELQCISVGGLKGKSLGVTLKNILRLPLAGLQSFRILRRFRPDAVLGVGGYASGPVVGLAVLLRIPTLIQEQNVFPGMTNRIVSRFVTQIALPFEEAGKYFRGRGILTGNPIRPEFFSIKPRKREEKFRLLVFGGSQGARILNRTIVEAVGKLDAFREKLTIIHQTGTADLEWVEKAYNRCEIPADVRPFIHNMAEVVESADLILCRAGASTISELIAARRASILVPFAAAANRHQEFNARAVAGRGGARMILEAELSAERLAAEIGSFLEAPEELRKVEEALKKFPREDAAKAIVDILEEIA